MGKELDFQYLSRHGSTQHWLIALSVYQEEMLFSSGSNESAYFDIRDFVYGL